MTWYIYYPEDSRVYGKNDLIFDRAGFRVIQTVPNPAGMKLQKVFGDAAVSWTERD